METRVCEWEKCDKPVVVGGVGRPRKFCSRSCRQRQVEMDRATDMLGLPRKRRGQSAAPVSGSVEIPEAADGGAAGVDVSSAAPVSDSVKIPEEPLPELPAPTAALLELSGRHHVMPFALLPPKRQEVLKKFGWTAEGFEEMQREELAENPTVNPLEDFFPPGL